MKRIIDFIDKYIKPYAFYIKQIGFNSFETGVVLKMVYSLYSDPSKWVPIKLIADNMLVLNLPS